MNVNSQCGCGFTEDYITMRGFRCFESSPHAATYRAELHRTTNTTVEELLHLIEQWIQSGPSLSVHLRLIAIDSSCDVQISSLGEAECDSSGKASGGVIGGAVVGVILAIIVLAAAAAIVILLYKYRPSIAATVLRLLR